MIVSLQIDMPDEATPTEVAAYLREQADNAAGLIEQDIINLVHLDDEAILIDLSERELSAGAKFITHEASIFRSE